MEKRLKRIEIILIGVIVLLIINLTISLVQNTSKQSNNFVENSNEKTPLPEDVTREFMNKIVFKVKTDYNEKDWTNLYDIFGDYAKSSIGPEQVNTQFENIFNLIGKIERYSFSHYDYIGFEEGAQWFYVYYKSRFSNGTGLIKLNLRSIDGKTEIVGLRLNLEELK